MTFLRYQKQVTFQSLTLVGSIPGLIREKPRQASDMASLVQVPIVKVESTN